MEGEKINRISELEKEIELKKAELRELKRKRHLDFGDYIAFGDGYIVWRACGICCGIGCGQ